MKRIQQWLFCASAAAPCLGWAAGTLMPVGSPHAAIEIRDHHVEVCINNGFARTEVIQTFHNPSDVDLEALYSFPVPKTASFSEVTICAGEQELHGEVLAKEEAGRVYEEEWAAGNDAGIADKNGYQSFDFAVSRVPAQADTKVRFVYYQPLEIDTGVGRYIYPLEEGGTDEQTPSFWSRNDKVSGRFSVRVEVKSAWPVDDCRVPGFGGAAQVRRIDDQRWEAVLDVADGALDQDFVLYYRLRDGLPGRLEVVPYRENSEEPGTFMLVLTPGIDLAPLTDGADYLFVLDVSGSMRGKIATLARGIEEALGTLRPEDRFRVVVFNDRARDLTDGWLAATVGNVAATIERVKQLQAAGSTNLYEGLQRGLRGLDADRATSLVLVTDAVTNTGVVDPASFHALMKRYDVRVFGFVMGNSANWPLMRVICDATGGFYAGVSNQDDIAGQIMLAKSKVTHACLHDATLTIKGARTFDTTSVFRGKLYRGQQLTVFGRYEGADQATVTLKARITGEERTYHASFAFPEIDRDNPELERLWAMSWVEEIEAQEDAGLLDADEARSAVRDIGVAYQIVTDETSMVVLSDEAFASRGIERRNWDRTAIEHEARAQRTGQPVRNYRVDRQTPMFNDPAPSLTGGLGAFDPVTGGIAAALCVAAWRARRKSRRDASDGVE